MSDLLQAAPRDLDGPLRLWITNAVEGSCVALLVFLLVMPETKRDARGRRAEEPVPAAAPG